ncbi:MAG: magnesium transporter [Oscillospiraceae bacterium]|nr:magnesium transporter [Oscillospiraceae bacterium]
MGENMLELLRARRIKDLRSLLAETNPVDIAAVTDELVDDGLITKEELLLLFRITPKDIASDTFVEMSPETQQMLITGVTDAELHDVLNDLFLDDAVDLIEEMPAGVVKRILKNVDAQTRKSINQLLNYPEDSAGSLMTIEYVDLKRNMTVEQCFQRIRKTGVDKETIYTCYVTDRNRKLLGLVSVKDLLLASYEDEVGDIMEENVISVTTSDDQELVAQMFGKYDFMALPVVDSENRLVGIITVDDAIDVMQEEFTEDIEKMAAITPTDKPYLRMSVFEIWRVRIPWLLLLMVSATFTGIIITSFESALAAQIALTAFIPMLMDTAGNSGSQASVTVIRALSLGDVEFGDILEILWKEARVSLLCGLSLSAVAFAKLLFLDKVGMGVALVVSITLACTIVLAKLVGCTLPLFSKKLGFDPAVMSAPFITTIVDALSLLIYFQVASLLLGL